MRFAAPNTRHVGVRLLGRPKGPQVLAGRETAKVCLTGDVSDPRSRPGRGRKCYSHLFSSR